MTDASTPMRAALDLHRAAADVALGSDTGRALRDERLPLPGRADGYQTALLIGTTGGGKTTLVRQLLGTDQRTERFPSTSTAKTTVANFECILSDAETYEVVATFMPRSAVEAVLLENAIHAATMALDPSIPDYDIAMALLDHVNQRHRFSYTLGTTAFVDTDDDEDEDDDDFYGRTTPAAGSSPADVAVRAAVGALRRHAAEYLARASSSLTADREAGLAEVVREKSEIRDHLDTLLGHIAQRFDQLSAGTLVRDDRWGTSWSWSSSDRSAFLTEVRRLTSNNHAQFGTLLTPLVTGLRVKGRFLPSWRSRAPRLVLIDGEGVGHSAETLAELSSATLAQAERADHVVLVDNATQPMQAGAVGALYALTIAGLAKKTSVVFTHLDNVIGDNIPTHRAAKRHVQASLRNAIAGLKPRVGNAGADSLAVCVKNGPYFLGHLTEHLDEENEDHRPTITGLSRLVTALSPARNAGAGADPTTAVPARPARPAPTQPTAPAAPVAPRPSTAPSSRPGATRVTTPAPVTNPVPATSPTPTPVPRPAPVAVPTTGTFRLPAAQPIAAAAGQQFAEHWKAVLGVKGSVNREAKADWRKLKTLCERVAAGNDSHGALRPVDDLRERLQAEVYHALQRNALTTDQVNRIAVELTGSLTTLAWRRVIGERQAAWQRAAQLKGPGSTTKRGEALFNQVILPSVAAEGTETLTADLERVFADLAPRLPELLARPAGS